MKTDKRKLFLHICCSPCSIELIDELITPLSSLSHIRPTSSAGKQAQCDISLLSLRTGDELEGNLPPLSRLTGRARSNGQAGGWEIFGYFYNPNIHPIDEYRKRRDSVIKYLEDLDIKYEIADYDIQEYFDKIGEVQEGKERCTLCYDLRMERTASRAKELGYKTFSTTLLFNPHKDFELIAKVGRENAGKYGLHFHFPQLTHDYWKYKDKAKELEMYIQKYCGCVFSTTENS